MEGITSSIDYVSATYINLCVK